MGKHWKLWLAGTVVFVLSAVVAEIQELLVVAALVGLIPLLDWVLSKNRPTGDILHVMLFVSLVLAAELFAAKFFSALAAATCFVALTFVALRVAWHVSSREYQHAPFFLYTLGIVASQVLGFANVYLRHGLIAGDGNPVRSFEVSVYFSLVTWTTLGYGDFQPTPEVRLPAAMEAMLGYIVMGAFLALAFQKLNSNSAKPKDDSTAKDAPIAVPSDGPSL